MRTRFCRRPIVSRACLIASSAGSCGESSSSSITCPYVRSVKFGAVPELARDVDRVAALVQQQRSERVPQVVRLTAAKTTRREQRGEPSATPLLERVGTPHAAALARKDKCVVGRLAGLLRHARRSSVKGGSLRSPPAPGCGGSLALASSPAPPRDTTTITTSANTPLRRRTCAALGPRVLSSRRSATGFAVAHCRSCLRQPRLKGALLVAS
jgi:hypothetical protein